MKPNIVACLLMFMVLHLQSQNDTLSDLLITRTDWKKEVFKFPIGFAQDISYKGYEEAWFPPQWSDKTSDEFWTYAFIWRIKIDSYLTHEQLEADLEKYFDGLMDVHSPNLRSKRQASHVSLKDFGNHSFTGNIVMYDRFREVTDRKLNIMIEQFDDFDPAYKNVIFKFSPKEFDHAIWKQLNAIKLATTH